MHARDLAKWGLSKQLPKVEVVNIYQIFTKYFPLPLLEVAYSAPISLNPGRARDLSSLALNFHVLK